MCWTHKYYPSVDFIFTPLRSFVLNFTDADSLRYITMPLPTKPAKRELANRYSQFSALFADLGEELEKQLANNPSDKAIPHTYNGMRYESFSYGKVRRLLKRSSTGRLGPQQESVRGWLNDDIINAYLNLLCQDVKDFGYDQRAACIDSIAMGCLADGKCIDGGLRQSNVDGLRFFSKEMIFMPYLRNGNHWVLIVVFPQRKKIVHLDTSGLANVGMVQNVRRLIKEQHPEPAKQPDWPCYNLLDDIQSPNTAACGIFVLSFASSCIYGFMDTDDLPDDLVLRAGHMPYTILDLKHRPDVERESERTFGNKRLRVAAELLTGKISSHTWGMRRATRGPKGMLAEIVDLTLDGDSPEAEEPTELGDNFSSIDSTAYSDDEEEETQVVPTLEAGIGANGVRADKAIMFWQICRNSSADELLEYVKKNPARFPGFETKFSMKTMIWGQDLERWVILELQACEGMDDAWVLANRIAI